MLNPAGGISTTLFLKERIQAKFSELLECRGFLNLIWERGREEADGTNSHGLTGQDLFVTSIF